MEGEVLQVFVKERKCKVVCRSPAKICARVCKTLQEFCKFLQEYIFYAGF